MTEQWKPDPGIGRKTKRVLDSRSKPPGLGSLWNAAAIVLVVLAARPGWAGEGPFFITYTHQMEEPRNMEIASKSVPVLYVELENINGADKSFLEVVNHDGNEDLTGANSQSRSEKKREIEALR